MDQNYKGIASRRAKSILRYAMLPGVIPRIKGLGFHFGHFAYLLALVFNSARLIPAGHPALNPANIGHFGVRHIIALAANNLTWSRNHVDQIAIFAAIIIGILMLAIQAVLIAVYAFTGTAFAASPTESFFQTPPDNAPTDVILIFLTQVFGANLDIFGSATQPLGTSVHLGLQAILGFYSMATMVIAVIIVLYYVLTVIGEAAQSGTPFGRRFNSIWAPIRLVVALGLLVPLGSGLNSAQYLTLWTAKMGSGLATNVWSRFVGEMTETMNVISKPATESTTGLVKRIFLSEVCAASYNQVEQTTPSKITILQHLGNTSIAPQFGSPQAMILAAKNAGMGEIVLSWSNSQAGESASDYTCGFVSVSLTEFDLYKDGNLVGDDEFTSSNNFINWIPWIENSLDRVGSIHEEIKAAYLAQVKTIADSVRPEAEKIAAYAISIHAKPENGDRSKLTGISGVLQGAARTAHETINTRILNSYEELAGSDLEKEVLVQEMVKRGWGAAGLWYANIGKINQKFTEAVDSAAVTLGDIVDAEELDNPGIIQSFKSWAGFSRFGTNGTAGTEIEAAIKFADTHYADTILTSVKPGDPLYADAQMESSAGWSGFLSDFVLWLLRGGQLTDLRENPQLDPMARLMGAGNDMLDRSLLFFGLGAGAAAIEMGGKFAGPKGQIVGAFAGATKGFLFAMATVGMLAGMFLLYILPLLPFIYFAFAVIGWVLELFEAVIAMPLWALAHLRIDGDGMPGSAAIAGYQLLLMILLRPTLIVFGLIGGYVIFGAAVFFFSSLFNGATTIVRGEVVGGPVGGFGVFVYTIIFVFLVYNIAIMCFKMIDDVPKGILRWMGANAQTFNDSRPDPISGSREMMIGTMGGAKVLFDGAQSGMTGVSKAAQHRSAVKQGVDPSAQAVRVVGNSDGFRGTPPSGPGG